MTINTTSILAFVAPMALAGVMVAVVVGGTWVFGPGITTDGVAYVDAARHMASGDGAYYAVPDGEVRPLITWPPLFSVLLTPGEWLGVGAVAWARWIHALLLGAFAVIAMFFARSVIGGHAGPALVGALVALSGNMPELYSMIYSEPLFLTLQIAWMYLAWCALQRDGYRYVIALGVVTAMMILTRYTGAAFVLAGAALLRVDPRQSQPRALRAALFAFIAVAPAGLWLLRNTLAGGSAVERPLELVPFTFEWLLDVWRLSTLWLLPGEASRFLRHGLWLLLVGVAGVTTLYVMIRGARLNRHNRVSGMLAVCLFSAGSYFAFLVAATFLSPREPTLDLRMLAPLQLPVIFALGCGVVAYARVKRRPRVLLLIAALALVGGWRAVTFAQESNRDGLEFSNRYWADSPLLEHASQLPPDAVLVSNQAEAVYYHLGRPCLPLPAAADGGTNRDRLDPSRVERMHERLDGRTYYVLLFHQRWPWDAHTHVIAQGLDLQEAAGFGDGILYKGRGQPR